MHRPLWQIFLTLLVLGFIVQRATGATIVYLSEGPPVLLLGFALQIVTGLATAAGLWLGRRWVVVALACLGISVVATALLGGFYLRAWPAPMALSQSLVAALATGALALMLRHEFSSAPQDPPRRDSA